MLTKKIFISFHLSSALLFGGFIGDAIGNATSRAVGNVTQSGTDRLTSRALDWASGTGTSAATDFLFNSSSMSGFWGSIGGSYSTGTMEMCYKRGAQQSTTTPDICSMLGNTSLNACSALPSTLMGGIYVKKSSSEQLGAKLPLSDWCKKTLQQETNVAASGIKNYMGLSGKKSSELAASGGASAGFLSEANKAVTDKMASITEHFDRTAEGTVKETAYAKKVRRLNEAGMGHVAKSEIQKVAALNKNITPEQMDQLDLKVAFSSMSEYKADLYSKTASDGAAYRQFFGFESHIDIANSQFASMNQQQKTFADKKNFIDEYVENESGGLRKQYRTWAEEAGMQEIMYSLPRAGEKYYSSFNERSVLSNVGSFSRERDVAISVANHEISRQQQNEKSIILKWRQLADDKADELKVLLVKNAYASEVFNEAAARAEIAALMSAN
ncbi:MAG: hypothetical protein PHO62_07775 [Sulfurimonas sp.]|uniref:hypothetical protein n=1 Tax=Sulfurimonas sp. TaxID=2022749 RepID=UPI002637D9AE|nr:hypothetical protein [Sulfurimonas sp.]MDD5373305.1 hypothetical protein [Sulfurimonas sp.]